MWELRISLLTLGSLDFLIAPKDGNEEKPFYKLADHVEERKEEEWSDDFRGEGHVEDGRAELDILASGLHADSAAAPVEVTQPAPYALRGAALLACLLPPRCSRTHSIVQDRKMGESLTHSLKSLIQPCRQVVASRFMSGSFY